MTSFENYDPEDDGEVKKRYSMDSFEDVEEDAEENADQKDEGGEDRLGDMPSIDRDFSDQPLAAPRPTAVNLNAEAINASLGQDLSNALGALQTHTEDSDEDGDEKVG